MVPAAQKYEEKSYMHQYEAPSMPCPPILPGTICYHSRQKQSSSGQIAIK